VTLRLARGGYGQDIDMVKRSAGGPEVVTSQS